MRLLCTVVLLASSVSLACGWDYETFVAETGTLPCVEAVAVVRPPKHSPVLLQRRVDVADLAIALLPTSLSAHDARTNALLHLGKLDLALQSAKARAALAPDDYASRANLGTVLTFQGDLDAALVEVKSILEKDPDAHFGREKFHAQFLEYLLALKKNPDLAKSKDFLGLTLTNTDAMSGNAAKQPKGALDALVSMLGVYGASENPHLLYALGNVLALQGEKKLAFAAWKSALERKHPAKAVVIPWMEKFNTDAYDAWKTTAKERSSGEGPPSADVMNEGHWQFGDQWAGLWWSARKQQELWTGRAAILAEQEEKQLANGLPVWTEAGVSVLITMQRRLGMRCASSEPMRAGMSSFFENPTTTKQGVAPDARAWLETLETVVADVQDARSCELIRPTLTEKLKKAQFPKVPASARATVLNDAETRERFNDVFDRLALVLTKCAPKGGNAPVLAAWLPALK